MTRQPAVSAARFGARALVAALALSLGALAPARADMAAQMDAMLGAMVNVSPPGLYDTQRRGEISGGGVYARTRIVNANPVAFSPPSFRAGCGGIDFFAGSFSFINADQFTALMQAVAANAVGYAFNLALDQMCPQCMRTIETLQRKVQELNQHFGNSCQLAQGLVNDTLGAMTGKRYGEASIIGVAEGVSDVFGAWTAADGQSPTEAVAAAAPAQVAERLEGNLVWRALKRSSVASWFAAGGDDQVLSVMMNISGTVIVDYDETGDAFTVRTIAGKPELLESWIEGAPIQFHSCAGQPENGCLAPTLVNSTWSAQGFARAIFGRLTDPTNGAIAAIRTASSPSEALRKVVVTIPGKLGAMFVRLAAVSDSAAETFAREAAYQMAVELTAKMLGELYATVSSATDALDDAYTPQMKALIASSDAANRAELARLQRQHGSIDRLLATYEGYLGAIQPAVGATMRARLDRI